MELLQDITITTHVICASLLVITMIIMQLVVGPALSKLPPEERVKAQQVIQQKWHPIVDGTIIVLTITAIALAVWRFHQIGQDTWLHYKVSFGIVALICANTVHFYIRGQKRKMKEIGDEERLAAFTRFGSIAERGALIFGGITYVMGMFFNHLIPYL